ncbi:MAG: hypothetical protein EA377_05580 [Phycisphaerales bacterium]|nr:MAG: hypothetical protein EA377_05580 [Phycisphaerales bacterium]
MQRITLIGLLFLLAAVFTLPAQADITPDAGMLRYPHVSKTHITFVYANDIWLVPREGGLAKPLASPPGQEVNPRFSPDGKSIAFVGNYDGGRDIYTIPFEGGVPERITYHAGGKNFTGWTPDGEKLIYTSNFRSGQQRAAQIYTISKDGGHPEQLPIPYGDAGAISPDGQWLAYTPFNRDRRTWKRYRGGLASNIWLFNLNDHSSKQVTDWEGTDTLPMWAPNGDKLYYLSDRGEEARLNIWVYDMRRDRHEQITRFSEWDVKWPSIGPGPRDRGEIVFQNGPNLYLLNLDNNSTRTVDVRIPGDRPNIRTQRTDVSRFITYWNISPNAKRAVAEARGDIWTMPAENGSPRNLTRTSGIAERNPSWSPCAQWIAYFSDESGEYELYITQSDGRGETRQLTDDGGPFKYNAQWSPCSEYIIFTDKTSTIFLTNVEEAETKKVDQDPWATGGGRSGGSLRVDWSHDSQWITYGRTLDDQSDPSSAIFVYNVNEDEHHQLTSGYYNDRSPVFSRNGDWLYYVTTGHWSPAYSDMDSTFIYAGSSVLAAVPLREEIKSPWLLESDEETWDDEEEEAEEDEEAEDDDADAEDEAAEEEAEDDGVSGVWTGSVDVPEMGPMTFSMSLTMTADYSVTGTLSMDMFNVDLTGEFDPATSRITLTGRLREFPEAPESTIEATIDGNTMSGTSSSQGESVDFTAERTEVGADAAAEADADEARESVDIDIDGFERRAMRLPVSPGNFGRLAVNNRNQLLYVRTSGRGLPGGQTGIFLFDIKDDQRREQSVASGATQFEITPDGSKLLVVRGARASIQNAAAGASGKNVPTDNMISIINPREEWRQVVRDAWRIQRDFFYVDNLHGVDWDKIGEHYLSMVDDATSREDVSFIIGEMIGELNVGHAYYFGGDHESQPSVSVGSLGCDFAFDEDANAYYIERIYEAGDWDRDGFGPLSEAGIDVNEGDYLLEVNGVPVDPTRDVFASFQNLAGRTITITVSEEPEWDEDARDVVVRAMGSDAALRYRTWVEDNRRYVEEKTDGRVGYIHVPDTGVNGQNELVRQYMAQLGKEALIIDERWNGGGQIPTRFIEMLNRPVTNYWARRDGIDWKWPFDAHHGPKCMLINGPSGSGGDMFPWLFRHNDLGKLIGTRTWGGLVGISGNPALIDGGYTAVPTFGFYTKEGEWSIEGHGVDPDIEVIDDPAKMVDGGDPQLDRAIELMLDAADANPHVRPERPEPPDRSGFGIDPAHW